MDDTDQLLQRITSVGDFYQTGGSLPPDKASYVKREADDVLYNTIKEGLFAFVLAPRQTGKSSMRVRVMDRLRHEGYVGASIDVTSIGTKNVTAEQWYFSFLNQICRNLGLTSKLRTWWKESSETTPLSRVGEFFEHVMLQEISENIVVFVDEIESVLNLDSAVFNSTEFFRAIRSYYNARVDSPDFNRLHFVVLGTALPQELISDEKGTPFNIGVSIPLSNLNLESAQPLLLGFEGLDVNRNDMLKEIFLWTNGHPYLTQVLCQSVVRKEVSISDISPVIESHVNELFLKNKDNPDSNIANVRNRILGNRDQNTKMLGVYQELLADQDVQSDRTSITHNYLLLSGIASEDQAGYLQIDNKIYKSFFNEQWLSEALEKFNRPFAKDLNRWLEMNKSGSAALNGEVLRQALLWASDRDDLSILERSFLDFSQRLEKKEEGKKRRRLILFLLMSLFLTLLSIALAVSAWKNFNEASKQRDLAEINRIAAEKNAENEGIARKEADVQADLAKESARVATENEEKERIARTEADRQRRLAEARKIEALNEKAKADVARKRAEAAELQAKAEEYRAKQLKKLADAQALAYKASLNYGDNNEIYNSLLALESYSLNKEGEGNLLDPAVYEALRHANELTGKTQNHLKNIDQYLKSSFVILEGNILLAFTLHGKYIKYDINSQKILSEIDLKYKYPVNRSFIFPEHNMIVAGYESGTVLIWNLSNPNKPIELKGNVGLIRSVASPDGKTVATASRDNVIRIWKVGKTIAKMATARTVSANIRPITFTLNNQYLIFGDNNGQIALWDLSTDQAFGFSKKPSGRIISTAMDNERQMLITGYNSGRLEIIKADFDRINTNSSIKYVEIKNASDVAIEYITISDDSKLLAIATSDAMIKIFTMDDLSLKPIVLQNHQQKVNMISFGDNNEMFALGRDNKIWNWIIDPDKLADNLCNGLIQNDIPGDQDVKDMTGSLIKNTKSICRRVAQ